MAQKMKTAREASGKCTAAGQGSADASVDAGLKLKSALPPIGLAALIWLLLAGPDLASWLVGLPAAVAAGWSVLWLSGGREQNIRLMGLLGFLPFFVWESIRGGFDVVSRVMRPSMLIKPGFHTYHTRLDQSSARLLFVNSLSLLPGTLAADLDGDEVLIHALDVEAEVEAELQRLESAVAGVYGETI